MGIRWSETIGNTEQWETTGQKPIILQIRLRREESIVNQHN